MKTGQKRGSFFYGVCFWLTLQKTGQKRLSLLLPAMHLESLRALCLSLPAVTEDVKWEHDLCFSIGGKMFCVASLEAPLSFSFKVSPEDFHELAGMPGLTPAPYLARYHWILASDENTLSSVEVERRVKESYDLIKGKLPKKALKEAGLL